MNSFFDDNEKKHPIPPWVITALRAVLMFFLFRITAAIAYSLAFELNLFEGETEAVLFLSPLVAIGIWIFLLHSTLLNFSNFNRAERLKFLERYDESTDWPSEKRLLHKDKLFWLEIGVMTALFFAFFSRNTVFSEMFALIGSIPFVPDTPKWLQPILSTLVFFGILYGLEMVVRLEARNFWLNPRDGKEKTSHLWQSYEERNKKVFGYQNRICKLLISYGIIFVGSAVIMFVVAVAYSFVLVSWELIKQAAGWIILGLLFLLIFGLAIRKRFLFLHNLKRTCKSCGFRLLELKHPILAVFKDLKGYTFAVEANGEIYYCRLIASVKRSNKMIFLPDGTASRNLSFHIPQPALGGVRGFVQAYDRGNGDDREFARYARHFRYDFEAGEGKKILLLNPVPRRAVYDEDGKKSELDNGSRIGERGEYTVYSGNAFLRLLKRESMQDQ